jgi:hypothetical protein
MQVSLPALCLSTLPVLFPSFLSLWMHLVPLLAYLLPVCLPSCLTNGFPVSTSVFLLFCLPSYPYAKVLFLCLLSYLFACQFVIVCLPVLPSACCRVPCHWGLLDRSTARYFYKWLKTSLHKPTGNLLKISFSRKYAVKSNLQLLE